MVDFLIVGHGIGGVCIAEHLEQLGSSFTVINYEKPHSSSKVAAGLYNPITGRKMKKTWLADELFPYLEKFYSDLESKLKTKFLHKKRIYRPFTSVEEQNEWIGSDSDSDDINFVESVSTKPTFNEYVEDPFGGILLTHSGFVDLNILISAHKKYLLKKDLYLSEQLDYDQLEITNDTVKYKSLKARNIIFCDGPLSGNPLFNWVPTAPVKGEILHIQTQIPLPEQVIFNRGVFILKHAQQDFYRVGATYEWKNLDYNPTEKAKNQLIAKLDDLLKVPYTLIDQVAGIRPASKDRRPIIGNHPVEKNVFLFNGLGTKGVSLSPYFANNLCQALLKDEILKEEVNINRYYSLYSS